MKTLVSKKNFSINDKSFFENQTIRFVIYNKDFLIPDLYSTFKGKEFFLREFNFKNFLINIHLKLISILIDSL